MFKARSLILRLVHSGTMVLGHRGGEDVEKVRDLQFIRAFNLFLFREWFKNAKQILAPPRSASLMI